MALLTLESAASVTGVAGGSKSMAAIRNSPTIPKKLRILFEKAKLIQNLPKNKYNATSFTNNLNVIKIQP